MSSSKKVWIGFDLGGTKMLAKVFDQKFTEIGGAKTKTEGYRGMEAGLERMIETIEEALSAAKVSKSDVLGIGVGCPGPVDPSRGVLVEAPNLGWSEAPIADVLGKEFGCEVVLCNDVDAGAFAEYKFGGAKGASCAVAIFPGTGIGAGAVLNGHLVQGGNLSAMELGHIPLHPERGGGGGTLETFCSRLWIAAEAAKLAFRGLAPNLLALCGTDIAAITSTRLAEAIRAGDIEVEKVVRKAAATLGYGVASVVHLLAPDVIMLGGGLVEAMPTLYLGEVRDSANAHLLAAYRDSFKLVTAQLGDDSGVQGAAAWARRKIEG